MNHRNPVGVMGRLRPVNCLAGLLAIIGGVALLALVAVTAVAVIWRYVLNNPIFGIEDVSMMVLVLIIGASVACAAQHHNHVGVNVITWFVSRRITRITDLLARIATLSIVGLITYSLIDKGSCGLPCGAFTSNLSIIHTPFYYFLAVAFFCYFGLLVNDIVVGIRHWEGRDPNEPSD